MKWFGPTSPLGSGGQPAPHCPPVQASLKLRPAKFWLGLGIGPDGAMRGGAEGASAAGGGRFVEGGPASRGRYIRRSPANVEGNGSLLRSPVNSAGATRGPATVTASVVE